MTKGIQINIQLLVYVAMAMFSEMDRIRIEDRTILCGIRRVDHPCINIFAPEFFDRIL